MIHNAAPMMGRPVPPAEAINVSMVVAGYPRAHNGILSLPRLVLVVRATSLNRARRRASRSFSSLAALPLFGLLLIALWRNLSSHTKVCTYASYSRTVCLYHVRTDWNPVTLEQGLDPSADAVMVYAAEKTLAERFVWKFAEQHPNIDVTTGLRQHPSYYDTQLTVGS